MDIYRELGINTKSKQFKRYYKAGLLSKIDKAYIKEVKEYWLNKYEKNIDPTLHLAYYNLTGNRDVEIVPSREMWNEIIPYLNDLNMSAGYSDKNIYDKLITSASTVENVLKCVYGRYFDKYNNGLSENEALDTLADYSELIIKPSNTNNGIGIKKLSVNNYKLFIDNKEISLNEIIDTYNYDFVVQKFIKQHKIMAAPHPYSVNTLRMVTLRWRGEIIYLLTFARFGANQDVKDNAGDGGLCLGVDDEGNFHEVAIDANSHTYTHHPTTNFQFSKMDKIPNFTDFVYFVKDLHKDILHHNFVSWDIAIDEQGDPIFIEANYRGATWLYQLSTRQPLFGEYTTEIIEEIKDVRKDLKFRKRKRTQVRNFKSRIKKLRVNNNNLTKEITKLKKDINSKNVMEEKYKKELKNFESSTSWKITKPFRMVKNLFNKR